jgi:DNA-binding CsgD family transcriptional regulator
MVRTVAETQVALTRLIGQPVEAAEFSDEVGAAVRQILTFDGWCLFGTDPATGLRTSQFGGRGTENTRVLHLNEAGMSDVNSFAQLVRSATGVGRLSREHPLARQSFRLHEILLPRGFESEARLVLRDRGRMWGALALFREDPHRPFGGDDLAALTAIAPSLTQAMRAYPVRPLTGRAPALRSGVVGLAPDDRVVDVSTEARAWLDDLLPGGDDLTNQENVMRVVYEVAHAVRRGDTARSATCVRTVSGRWMRAEGAAISLGETDVVVILQAATVQQLLGTIAACHLLTPREAQILGLLVDGLAAKQMARKLEISALTVNEHLRSLYRKCGVTSRAELVGRLV